MSESDPEKPPPPPTPVPAPPNDDFLRGAGILMLVVGLGATVCWMLSRRYMQPMGSAWVADVAVFANVAYVVLGALVLARGQRWHLAARNYSIALLALSFAAGLVPDSGGVAAFTLLEAAAILFLVWGRAGKLRAVASFVCAITVLALLFVSTAIKVRHEPGRGPPVVCEVLAEADGRDVFAAVEGLPTNASTVITNEADVERHDLVFSFPKGATFTEGRDFADAWIADHVRLDPATHVAWQSVGESALVLRSHVLRDGVVFASSDVAAATVEGRTLSVQIRGEDAIHRLRDATRARSRLAVTFDGGVYAAMPTTSEVTNGNLTITDAGKGARDLTAVATALRGELLRAP